MATLFDREEISVINIQYWVKYLFDKKILNARQARWLAFLSEYDFEIKHIKGKKNIVEDALSRQQHKMHSVLISDYEY